MSPGSCVLVLVLVRSLFPVGVFESERIFMRFGCCPGSIFSLFSSRCRGSSFLVSNSPFADVGASVFVARLWR